LNTEGSVIWGLALALKYPKKKKEIF